jgi:flagellar basal body-associated protein FliL
MSECAGKEAEPEPEETEQPPEEEKGGGMGILLVVLLVAAAGGGAFYYLKILKPKQDAAKGSSRTDRAGGR